MRPHRKPCYGIFSPPAARRNRLQAISKKPCKAFPFPFAIKAGKLKVRFPTERSDFMRVPLIAFGLLVVLGLVLWLSGFFGSATPPAPTPAVEPPVAEAPVVETPAAEVPAATAPQPAASAVATSLRPLARTVRAPAPEPAPAAGTLSSAQRLDRLRYFDLRELAGYLRCPLTNSTLPADAADPTYCGGRVTRLDPRDPASGTPYTYTRINDSQFRFCTRLDDAAGFNVRAARLMGFDPATGCLTASIR